MCQLPAFLNLDTECGRCYGCIQLRKPCSKDYAGCYRDWYYQTFDGLKNDNDDIREEVYAGWDEDTLQDY